MGIKIYVLSIHRLDDNRINKYVNSFSLHGYDVIDIHFIGNESNRKGLEIQFPVSTNKFKRRFAFYFQSRILKYIKSVVPENEGQIIFHIHDPVVLNLSRYLKKLFKYSKIIYDRHEFYEQFKKLTLFPEDFFYEKINKKYIDLLIVVNEYMKKKVEKYFPNIQTLVIDNFPIKENFIDRKDVFLQKNETLTISYVGALYWNSDRDIQLILDLIYVLKNEKSKYKFYIAGEIHDNKLLKEFKKREEETENKFCFLGKISRIEAIELTKKSHIGLLFLKPEWTVPYSPNKMYEYIQYGVIPILRLNISDNINIRSYTDYFYSPNENVENIKLDFLKLVQSRRIVDCKIKELLSKEYCFYWENDISKLFVAIDNF
jgi:hypothetical protein